MIAWPLGLFFLGLVLSHEVFSSGRTWRDFFLSFKKLSYKKTSPSPNMTALIFSTLAFLFFSLWESFVRILIQADASRWLSFVGMACGMLILGSRVMDYQRHRHGAWPMAPYQWTFYTLGFGLVVQAWCCVLLLGGWVFWRSLKALPKRPRLAQ